MIHSVSKLSTSVAAQPPNVFFPPPDTGRSSSHVHACASYAAHERTKASLTAALRARACAVSPGHRCGGDDDDDDCTGGRSRGRPAGCGVTDCGGKNSSAPDQSTDDGRKRSGPRDGPGRSVDSWSEPSIVVVVVGGGDVHW